MHAVTIISTNPSTAHRIAFFRYVCGSSPACRSAGSVAAQTSTVPSTASAQVTANSSQSQDLATPPLANARPSRD